MPMQEEKVATEELKDDNKDVTKMVGCALTKEKRERPKLSGDSKIKENVFKNLFVTKQEDLKTLIDGITSAISSSTAMTTAERHPP